MKVAIVGIYPRDPDRIRGGVEAVTLRLSRGLARIPEVDVHVVVAEPGRPVGVTRTADGVTVHSIASRGRLGNVTLQREDRRRIAAALREIAPDVVHAHSTHREALGAIESGLPAVVTIHGLIEQEIALEKRWSKRVRGVFRRRVVDLVFRRMRHVILLGPSVADHYGNKLAHARTWIIENPVDDLFFDTHADRDTDRLIYSGLVIPRKGIRNLLRALHIVRERRPAVTLRIAGLATMPDYEAQVRATVEELDLGDAVESLGALAPRDLVDEYARATAMLLVSKQETLPVSIQEAMAAGLPVIASPVGGVPHLVRDGENGFLVPWGDPELLARRILEVLEDPGRAQAMGRVARRMAEDRFRLDGVCRRTLEVYREVIAAGVADTGPGRGERA